jgi:hypothetical protein
MRSIRQPKVALRLTAVRPMLLANGNPLTLTVRWDNPVRLPARSY